MTDTTVNYININKDVKDPNYRYKMSEVEIKIEGGGQYLRTVVTNLDKIANSLLTTPEILNHYLGLSLGTNSGHQAKSDHLFIQGEHSKKKIQKVIYKYIDEFLICPKCRIPDTCFKIAKGKKKKQQLSLVCQSCGKDSLLSNSKIDSKMINYIIHNPPNNKDHREMENQNDHPDSNFGQMFSFDIKKPNSKANPEEANPKEVTSELEQEEQEEEEEIIEPSPIGSSSSSIADSDEEFIIKEVVIDLRQELNRFNSTSSSSSNNSTNGSDNNADSEPEVELPEPNLFKDLVNNLEFDIQKDDENQFTILEIPLPSELKIKPARSASPLFKKKTINYTYAPSNNNLRSHFSNYNNKNYGYGNSNKYSINNYNGYNTYNANDASRHSNKYARLSQQHASRILSHTANDRGSLMANEVRELMRVARSSSAREKRKYLYDFLKNELMVDDDDPYSDFNFSVNRVRIVSKHLKLESLVAGLMADILVSRDCHGFHIQVQYYSKYFHPFVEGIYAEKAQLNILDAVGLIFIKRRGDLDIDSIIEELYLNNVISADVIKEWFLNGSTMISDDDMEDIKNQMCNIIETFRVEDEYSDYEDQPPDYFKTMIHADGSVWEPLNDFNDDKENQENNGKNKKEKNKQKEEKKEKDKNKNKRSNGLHNIVRSFINSSSEEGTSEEEADDIMPDLEFDDTTTTTLNSYLGAREN